MSTEVESGSKPRYETIMNNIRKEAAKIRDAAEKLEDFRTQLQITGHPAPAEVLHEAATTIRVALVHVREVFRDF